MKIGLDATAMSSGEGFGVQTYAYNLAKHLLEVDGRNEYVVYCRRGS